MNLPSNPFLLAGSAFLFLGLPARAPAQAGPVLVELFTSQGCSSCPPAEKWLNEEGMRLFREGKILPLAYHVDYWDYLGWKDPYSSPRNTQGQRDYAALWRSPSVYTPQMIVQGKAGFVGSDADRARKEIEKASSRAAAFPFPVGTRTAKSVIQAGFHGSIPKGLEAWVVLFENRRTTRVERGENAGRTLAENFVVLDRSPFQETSPGHWSSRIDLPKDPDLKEMGLAFILRDRFDLHVKAAAGRFPLDPRAP